MPGELLESLPVLSSPCVLQDAALQWQLSLCSIPVPLCRGPALHVSMVEQICTAVVLAEALNVLQQPSHAQQRPAAACE